VTTFPLIVLFLSFFLSFFVFLSFFSFFFLMFFLYFSALFFFICYSFQVYFKFSMQKIQHQSQTLPSLAVFVPEPSETNMTNGYGSWSVGCPGCLLARLSRGFAKCRIKERKVILGLTKRLNQRYLPSFSTLSWLYIFYIEIFSLPSITAQFITVNVHTLLQGRVYNS